MILKARDIILKVRDMILRIAGAKKSVDIKVRCDNLHPLNLSHFELKEDGKLSKGAKIPIGLASMFINLAGDKGP